MLNRARIFFVKPNIVQGGRKGFQGYPLSRLSYVCLLVGERVR